MSNITNCKVWLHIFYIFFLPGYCNSCVREQAGFGITKGVYHSRLETQLTNAEREGAVPRPSLTPQAGENLGAFQGVARITAVRHRAASKVTLVLPLVAKLRDAGILAFYQLKTLKGKVSIRKKKIITHIVELIRLALATFASVRLP